MLKSGHVQRLDITADQLVRGLLKLSETEHVSLLDSCGVSHLGSHRLIAGVRPTALRTLRDDPEETLSALSDHVQGDQACIFDLSYELGAALNGIKVHRSTEAQAFVASFRSLIVHDYDSDQTFLAGDADSGRIEHFIRTAASQFREAKFKRVVNAESNFTRDDYLRTIGTIQERIRCGDTYQTNLTQQIRVVTDAPPQQVFWRLRRDHPAPYAAFVTRDDSTVVSASPERFFRIGASSDSTGRERARAKRTITTSPIKGTRRRGSTAEEDAALRQDLLQSPKDRAENTMIVDLLRNDLGRVCDYGSVRVEKLCELEEHPTLFHLVSTISGELRDGSAFSDVLRALFPCGSITGAPKIATMKLLNELEPAARGMSMGAIGYSIPDRFADLEPGFDLSVAIRTMVFRDGIATFNVGGGVTIDSDPQQEYEESLLKAKALLCALGARA